MASFRKRHAYGKRVGKLPPWAPVLICAVCAILVAVLVGNLLRLWLDDETYLRLTEGTTQAEDPPSDVKDAPTVNALPFVPGQSMEELSGRSQLSLSINTPEGVLNYTSPVSQYQQRSSKSEVTLAESVEALSAFGAYVSGVFYPEAAFIQSGVDLRYACASEDAALLREFLQAGGREILLVGLPFQSEDRDSVLTYLEILRASLEDATVGVSVPLSSAEGEYGSLLLEELLTICDFLVLDLTDAKIASEEKNEDGVCLEVLSALEELSYYREQYGMRILLTEEQAVWIDSLTLLEEDNIQVITHQAKSEANG